MTNRSPNAHLLSGPGIMLFSAAIFGFFGFLYANWNTPGVNGQIVLFRVMCGWTLKVSAITFAASAAVTLMQPLLGNLLYALIGLLGAIMFVIVAVLDTLDKQHAIMAYGPLILFIFAAWNGYGSWTGLRIVLALRGRSPREQ